MNMDVQKIIILCTVCNKPNKFKSLKEKLKLYQIMDYITDMLNIFDI